MSLTASRTAHRLSAAAAANVSSSGGSLRLSRKSIISILRGAVLLLGIAFLPAFGVANESQSDAQLLKSLLTKAKSAAAQKRFKEAASHLEPLFEKQALLRFSTSCSAEWFTAVKLRQDCCLHLFDIATRQNLGSDKVRWAYRYALCSHALTVSYANCGDLPNAAEYFQRAMSEYTLAVELARRNKRPTEEVEGILKQKNLLGNFFRRVTATDDQRDLSGTTREIPNSSGDVPESGEDTPKVSSKPRGDGLTGASGLMAVGVCAFLLFIFGRLLFADKGATSPGRGELDTAATKSGDRKTNDPKVTATGGRYSWPLSVALDTAKQSVLTFLGILLGLLELLLTLAVTFFNFALALTPAVSHFLQGIFKSTFSAYLPPDEATSLARYESLKEHCHDLLAYPDAWLPGSAIRDWKAGREAIPQPTVREIRGIRRSLDADGLAQLEDILSILDSPQRWANSRNRRWLRSIEERERKYFDTLFDQPLHRDQVRAVLTDEDHTFVLAGAGTGKTATLVAKVAWLVEKQGVPQKNILALSFNKKASKELADRLSQKGLSEVTASTFHAIGMRIVNDGQKRPLTVSSIAENAAERRRFFEGHVRRFLTSPGCKQDLLAWFGEEFLESHEKPPRSYQEYLRSEHARYKVTLSGKKLRSCQEVYIANWLTLNGVRWEYERQYPKIDKRYRPDFYFPDYDLWLEHWGISRKGKGFPGLDVARYQAMIETKRKCHYQNGTTLLETWSDDVGPRKTGRTLKRLLSDHDVALRMLTADEVDEIIGLGHAATSRLSGLIDQFLSLYRGRCDGLCEIQKDGRDEVFLRLFDPVFNDWKEHLRASDAIDFDEMLMLATKRIQWGEFKPEWTHILVDELQDVSLSRVQLIEALRDAVDGSRVVGVGDDWQSINRFAGADVGLFTSLKKRWRRSESLVLRQTWRVPEAAAKVSEEFVQQNPAQLRKELLPKPDSDSGRIVIVWKSEKEEIEQAIERAIAEILKMSPQSHVRVLARYNKTISDVSVGRAISRARAAGLSVDATTVHTAKGLECDHAILLDLEDSPWGFPSTREEDPVLRLVLSPSPEFPLAEERRLFYVSLTRAKESTWLITPETEPSPFVEEVLEQQDIAHRVCELGSRKTLPRCPSCEQPSIRSIPTTNGVFWSCKYYPNCEGTLATCPECDVGAIARDAETDKHACCHCGHEPEICPRCGIGHLKLVAGRESSFWACSEWDRGYGCDYTSGLEEGKDLSVAGRNRSGSAPVAKPAKKRKNRSVVPASPTPHVQGKSYAISVARDLLGPLTFLDLETSRVDGVPRIVEIGAYRWEGGEVTDELVTLVNPGTSSIGESFVHLISLADVVDAPRWTDLLPAFRRLVQGTTVVSHSISTESGALMSAFSAAGGRWGGEMLCTLKLAKKAHPDRSGRGAHSLPGLAELYGIAYRSHIAADDAMTLITVLGHLLERAGNEEEKRLWLRHALEDKGEIIWPCDPGDPPALKTR